MDIAHGFGGDTLILVDLDDGKGPHNEKILELMRKKRRKPFFSVLTSKGRWSKASVKYCGEKMLFFMWVYCVEDPPSQSIRINVEISENQIMAMSKNHQCNSFDLLEETAKHMVDEQGLNRRVERDFCIAQHNAMMRSKRYQVYFLEYDINPTFGICIEEDNSGYFALGEVLLNKTSGILAKSCSATIDLDHEWGDFYDHENPNEKHGIEIKEKVRV